MVLQFSDYQDTLDELGEHASEVLRAIWQDAAKVFSYSGLEAYIRGAVTLKTLGRGTDLVISFIESAPLVAREIGEEAVSELLSTAIKMYSKTSAEVLALVFSTAPTAAVRLGELELFKSYLTLLNNLLTQVPRAIRPLLGKLDVLLGHLTLGGMRRWAMWGVSAYRTDFVAQDAYFSLQSQEALAVMKREQRGVVFVDVQRRLAMYLRALWGRDFFLRPTSGDFETREGYRPYIEQYFIHLPDAFDDYSFQGHDLVPGMEVYRAAAAHAGAHMIYSIPDPEAKTLTTLQRALIGVIEDGRVEALSMRMFPGLKQLWLPLLSVDPTDPEIQVPILDRIAYALIDENYADTHPIVSRARDLFADANQRLEDPGLAHEIGLELASQFESMGISYNVQVDQSNNPFRDDNRHLWQDQEIDDARHIPFPGEVHQVRRQVTLMEMINTLDVEFASDDAQEIWVLPTELYDDNGTTFNELEGKEPVSSPFHYHEWDYQIQQERPNWVTLLEKRPKFGDPTDVDAIIEKHKMLVRRIKRLIESVQPQGMIRQRKVEGGDEIDLDAAIRSLVDMRMNMQPDPRIGIRSRLQIRDLSVLVLIDLSESTNDNIRDAQGEVTVLDIAREATVLLADALAKIGDPFAIHGFDSNGRHDVEYYRFKDFESPFDDKVKARLAAMTGQLSTRMGTALRHASGKLKQRPSHKKLILLLTDGEPADNDVRDPQYLRYDTKKAVEELARQGVHTFCLTLDPSADTYVSQIFGAKNYMVLDHVAKLPEKLSTLYLGLTR